MAVPALSGQFDRAKGRALVAVQQRLVAVAKARHAAVMQREPRPSTFLRLVDGHRGALEETVKAAGVIVYLYDRIQIGFERDPRQTISRLQRIVDAAIETLRAHSPVGTGRDHHPGQYRDSHKLYVNGRVARDVSGWRPGDEIRIVNALVYSRNIEVGRMQMRISGTDHVYEQSRQVILSLYGDQVDVTFTFTNIEDDRVSRNRGKAGGNRFPSLVIRPISEQSSGRFDRAADLASAVVSTLSVAHTATLLAANVQPQLLLPRSQ